MLKANAIVNGVKKVATPEVGRYMTYGFAYAVGYLVAWELVETTIKTVKQKKEMKEEARKVINSASEEKLPKVSDGEVDAKVKIMIEGGLDLEQWYNDWIDHVAESDPDLKIRLDHAEMTAITTNEATSEEN